MSLQKIIARKLLSYAKVAGGRGGWLGGGLKPFAQLNVGKMDPHLDRTDAANTPDFKEQVSPLRRKLLFFRP